MDAVLGPLRREPSFTLYVWALWAKAPNLLWLVVVLFDLFALNQSLTVH